MIARLCGQVIEVNPYEVVIDVSGVGYQIFCTPQTAGGLTPGQLGTVYTSMVVREDAISLYGFANQSERDTFELMRTVSGVGVKTALAMLAVMSPEKIVQVVHSEDFKALTAVPGIGSKGAQRIVLELKDKVAKLNVDALTDANEPSGTRWREQVVAGLVGLGWPTKQAEAACDQISVLADTNPEIGVAGLLKAALRRLAK